mmetsp:Transcript_12545/g.22885  ORF Transcript_12545/g.22885 Transcript_12545/m.22885 type:complete len:226 (+) Transcript_12545:962-1639(+)
MTIVAYPLVTNAILTLTPFAFASAIAKHGISYANRRYNIHIESQITSISHSVTGSTTMTTPERSAAFSKKKAWLSSPLRISQTTNGATSRPTRSPRASPIDCEVYKNIRVFRSSTSSIFSKSSLKTNILQTTSKIIIPAAASSTLEMFGFAYTSKAGARLSPNCRFVDMVITVRSGFLPFLWLTIPGTAAFRHTFLTTSMTSGDKNPVISRRTVSSSDNNNVAQM